VFDVIFSTESSNEYDDEELSISRFAYKDKSLIISVLIIFFVVDELF
jgi:hypothetical protein